MKGSVPENLRPRTSKLDAVNSQLEAAVLLILKGFDPRPVHTLIWASRSVLWDRHRKTPNPVIEAYEDAIERRVKEGFSNEWWRLVGKLANFLKHADRDPDRILEGFDIAAINELLLGYCIIAFSHLRSPLPERLAIGLSFVGFKECAWLDFRGVCRDLGMPDETFEKYYGMSGERRQQLMLEAFEYSLLFEPRIVS